MNGYQKNIHLARLSLQHLLRLPDERRVMMRMLAIEEYILYYDLTNVLLDRLRVISPSLFAQVDTIVDQKGRKVDVYVKFIPQDKRPEGALATTNLNQLDGDEHAYVSEYGPHTVSVIIAITKHSLLVLAHEFGHISYQIPNLAAYINFFKRTYPNRYIQADYLGHKPHDPSGRMAVKFEKQFKDDAAQYYDRTDAPLDDPIIIRAQLAKMRSGKKLRKSDFTYLR